MTQNYVALTLEAGNELAMAQFERVMRVMASEHRFSRRVLSIAIRERAFRALNARIGSILPSSFNPGVLYVLLIADHDVREPYEQYRETRRRELTLRVYAVKAAQPAAEVLIGIGLDAANGRGGSEDFIYVDSRDWDPAEMAKARTIRDEFGFFAPERAQLNRLVEDEFPNL